MRRKMITERERERTMMNGKRKECGLREVRWMTSVYMSEEVKMEEEKGKAKYPKQAGERVFNPSNWQNLIPLLSIGTILITLSGGTRSSRYTPHPLRASAYARIHCVRPPCRRRDDGLYFHSKTTNYTANATNTRRRLPPVVILTPLHRSCLPHPYPHHPHYSPDP